MSLLDATPLQIYSSALIFSPRKSIVRNIFEHRYTSWIKTTPAVEQDWGIEFQNLQLDFCVTDGVVFSPDDMLIAAIGFHEVQIANIRGERLFSIRGTADGSSFSRFNVVVSFSSNSRLIAMSDSTNYIQIWNISISKCIQTIQIIQTKHQIKWRRNYPISFTDCDKSILTTSPRCTEIRCIKTGALVRSITYPCTALNTALAPNASAMAVQFHNCIILWSIESCERIRKIDYIFGSWENFVDEEHLLEHIGQSRITLCQNLETWIQDSFGEEVFVISPSSGEKIFLALRSEFESCTFAGNSLIAVINESIKVWNLDSRQCTQILPAPRSVGTIAYAPKASLLVVSALSDLWYSDVLFFWRLRIDRIENVFGDSKPASSIVYRPQTKFNFYISSPNAAHLAYIGHDYIYLWCIRGGVYTAEQIQIEGRTLAAFSSTGQFFATINYLMGTITIWDIEHTPRILREFSYKFSIGEGPCEIFFSPDSALIGLMTSRPAAEIVNQKQHSSFTCLFSITTSKQLSDIGMVKEFKERARGACISYDNRLISIATENEAFVWEIGHDGKGAQEIFATNGTSRALFTGNGDDHWALSDANSVRFSPDSSLLLFYRKEVLEIWQIGQGTCLQRIRRNQKIHATMHPTESSILTNVGKISYRLKRLPDGDLCHDSNSEMGPSTADVESPGSLSHGSFLKMSYSWVGWGLSNDRCWITWNSENWLWLPMGSRPDGGAVNNNSIMIGSEQVGERLYEFFDNPKLEDRLGMGTTTDAVQEINSTQL